MPFKMIDLLPSFSFRAMFQRGFCSGAIFFLLVAISHFAMAQSEPNLLFEASFSGESGAPKPLEAKHAAGDPVPHLPTGEMLFEPDLVAHSGFLGLKIGPGALPLSYNAKKNLADSNGTISIRFVSDRLGRADSAPWTVFAIGPENGPVLLKFERKPGGGFIVSGQDVSGKTYRLDLKEPADGGEDGVQIEIRYTQKNLSVLANGQILGEQAWSGAPAWDGRFLLGGESSARGESAAVAQICFYKGVGQNIPSEKQSAGLKPGQSYGGEPTPWWEAGMPRLGLEALQPDYVPAPFTPVDVDHDKVRVWGRDYSVNGHGLLKQVTSASQPLLSGDVVLHITTQGKERKIEFGAPRTVSQNRGKTVLSRTSSTSEVAVTATYTFEYDGMIWVELEIKRSRPEALEALSITVPFQPAISKYIQYVGAPHKHESQNLARNSNAMALPATGPSLKLGFKTYVWIGNTEAGLQWFAESDEGWWPLDRPDCIQIDRRTDGGANLVLRIQDQPIPETTGAPVSIRFGFMATPVKPMPEGWRSWTFSAQYGAPEKTVHRGNNVIYWPDEWRSMVLDAEPHRALPEKVAATRNKNQLDHGAGRMILPYWTRIHLPVSHGDTVNPDAAKMVEMWGTEPNRSPGREIDHRRVSMATAWKDYLVWCFDEWVKKFGHADGVYLDESQPIPNTKETSNGGYVSASGQRRPTFEFQGSRDYMKRIQYLVDKRTEEPARSMVHNSSTYCMPYMSQYAVFLSGEQMNSGYFQYENPKNLPPEEERAKGYYYCHMLPMDRLIAEGYGKQWGIPVAWLPQFKNQKDNIKSPVAARDLLSRIQQVDTLIWPLFMEQTEVRKMLKFREEFKIGDSDVEFVPYWENREIFADDDAIKIGYYTRPGEKLVIVSNLGYENKVFRLKVPGSENALVQDAVTHQIIPQTNQQIELAIPRNDYQALLVLDSDKNSQTDGNPKNP